MATLDNPKRYRLTVPAQDTSVQDWIAAQLNISASIRQLIRKDIQSNGYTDVTCRQVEQGAKRGRPSNAELERRETESQNEPPVNSYEPAEPEFKAPPVTTKQQSVPVTKPVQTATPEQTQPVPTKDPKSFMLGNSNEQSAKPNTNKKENPHPGLNAMLDSIMA